MKEHEIITTPEAELITSSDVPNLLSQIRPAWKSKSLIKRVQKLLPVDASSACQRLFNAAIHDLRDKVICAGIDIAKEAAEQNRLPSIEKNEDIEDYSASKIIDLSYRIGILSRSEWRKLHRVYEIRRDLEHEDDEYVAGIEDCIYVFKVCVDVVLSRDAQELLRVDDVKQIIETEEPVALSSQFRDDYEIAPVVRQEEICKYLVKTALYSRQPDIVKGNAYNLLIQLEGITKKPVKINIAKLIQERTGRKPFVPVTVRVASAIGAMPFLKRAHLTDFFRKTYEIMEKTGYSFTSHEKHGELLRNFIEVGGLAYCPKDVAPDIIKWLTLAYIGEPGGYGWGRNRKVFYSNVAAPLIISIFKASSTDCHSVLIKLSKDKDVKKAIVDKYIARRFQELLDMTETE